MYRSATLAIVVSSTSMKVGTTTAAATNQGLIAGRIAAVGARATLLMPGLLRCEERRRTDRRALRIHPSSFRGRWGLWEQEDSMAKLPRRSTRRVLWEACGPVAASRQRVAP